jgi:hypothetical protein
MSFEQIDSAVACMPVYQEDGALVPGKRDVGISVDSMEQVREINDNWRDYVRI